MLTGAQSSAERLAANQVCRQASEFVITTSRRSPGPEPALASPAARRPTCLRSPVGDLEAVDADEGLLGPALGRAGQRFGVWVSVIGCGKALEARGGCRVGEAVQRGVDFGREHDFLMGSAARSRPVLVARRERGG